jgi:hypothetical protein
MNVTKKKLLITNPTRPQKYSTKSKLGIKFTKGNEPSQPPKPQLPDEWNLIPFQT